MHRSGLLVGIATFLLIGSFHVVVIKGEYHFGKGIWSVLRSSGRLRWAFPFSSQIYLSGRCSPCLGSPAFGVSRICLSRKSE